MRYLINYESFRNSKENTINEGIFGNLFSKLKDKISLGFSKQFGSASKIDGLIEEYKKEVMIPFQKKLDAITALGKYMKSLSNGADEDQKQKEELIKALKTVSDNYQKQKDLIKKKFDIKFNELVSDEKNQKVKNYINLKKIEMEQDLLNLESDSLLNKSGLTEEDTKDNPELTEILNGIVERTKQSQKAAQEQTDLLKNDKAEGEVENKGFNFEEAIKDKNYNWKDSKFIKDYKFEPNEELTFWSNKNYNGNKDYKGTTAYVSENQTDVKDNLLKIYLEDKNKSFAISKGKIISTKKDEELKAKEESQKSKEVEKTEAENTNV